jgi:hypothetical protein
MAEGIKRYGEEIGVPSSLPPLFFNNSLYGTDLGTGPTFGTFLFINHIGLPLFNGLRRTFFSTGSTSDTLFRNDIGHHHHPLYV